MKKQKPTHLIQLRYGYECRAVCDSFAITPIEATIKMYFYLKRSKGTFNPTKVTCKRCLKHSKYKEAMDRVKYPLLFWKEGTNETL